MTSGLPGEVQVGQFLRISDCQALEYAAQEGGRVTMSGG